MSEVMNVVMVPWLAFGHMIPFLELSIALAKSRIHISFISTPKNIQRLPKIPPNLSQFIDFIPIPFPVNPEPEPDSLPKGAESTHDIPANKMETLKKACDLLQDPIKNFISQKPPNFIIVDFFPHWAADIAQEFNIPLITFYINNACTSTFFLLPELLSGDNNNNHPPRDLTRPPHWIDFPSKVAYKNHEVMKKKNVLSRVNSTGFSDGQRLMKLIKASRAVAMRTCPELEADYIRVYRKVTGKPVFPVGFLPPKKVGQGAKHEEWSKIFNWLDGRNPQSLVFVGFGSEANLSREEIHEIAYGLELSKIPFLWALRKPKEANDDVLPLGFLTRTAEQGMVEMGWVPQMEILGHASVGGLFVHAGWSSIIEAMQFGHVLVFLPLAVDQPMNARLMAEEKGLGVEVERGEDGSFTRNDVAGALKKAMLCDHELRARAGQAARDVFGNDDLNCKYAEEFAEYLKNSKFD